MATAVGLVSLPRQVLFHPERGEHTVPSNGWLPAHAGRIYTRRLQEWVCLLGSDFPFSTAQRLLGWQTGEAKLLCPNEVRHWVGWHGQRLREGAAAEVAELATRPDLGELAPHLQPARPPRRPAAWPAELNQAVAAAVAAQSPTPPAGVTRADWERVLAASREPREPGEADDLARLGPEIAADQVLVMADEVLVRQPERRTFAELRTARVATAAGVRYLCGSSPLFEQPLFWLTRLCRGKGGWLTLLGDGARWLGELFRERLGSGSRDELVLDWYHLRKKCQDRVSRMGGSRSAKRALLKRLLRALWEGDGAGALAQLEEYRPSARNEAALEELAQYLRRHEPAIPNYRERRAQRQYIGSGPVEKANDLLVARRQKRRGMHWRPATSEALASLQALRLNGDWDDYWQHGLLPSLVAG